MRRRLQRIQRNLDRMGVDRGARRNSVFGVTRDRRGVRVTQGS